VRKGKGWSALSCAVALGVTFGVIAATASPSGASDDENRYRMTRLVSDRPGVAEHLDTNLVNAWGLVAGPSTPWWVANNGTDTSTLYDGTGTPLPLVVGVPGAPTGTVFNGGPGFVVSNNGASGPSLFLFAGEDGTIHGWNPGVPPPAPSTTAFKVADLSGRGAIFKGLAIATTMTGSRLYATDFHNGKVDVWDENFDRVRVPGAFWDQDIPAGYGPFGIQTIRGHVFVTYAKQDADAEDDVRGAGFGFVDEYTKRGVLVERVASRGALNAPWGLAWAPDGFGEFGDDLLIGNFGDGNINAFHQEHDGDFELEGSLARRDGGDPMSIDGLWALRFGNGGPAGQRNQLFFTAGPKDEEHGLFGMIEAVS
jgi:uncharacterized protein (TIGR03118 family)